MSTVVQDKPSTEIKKIDEHSVSYIPLGQKKEMTLTIAHARKYVANKTKSGQSPSDGDLVNFLMLCQSNLLNPWVGDAYLIGYDTSRGPKYSMIVSAQALFKRAELSPEFDGLQSGVVVRVGDGPIEYREGDLFLKGEELLGGWAKVYRKDRKMPFYDSLLLSTFDKHNDQWQKDPAGMIVKCAEVSALRKAFPNSCAGLYIEGERERIDGGSATTNRISKRPTEQDVIDKLENEVVDNSESEEFVDAEIVESVVEDGPNVDQMEEWDRVQLSIEEIKTIDDAQRVQLAINGTVHLNDDQKKSLTEKLATAARSLVKKK